MTPGLARLRNELTEAYGSEMILSKPFDVSIEARILLTVPLDKLDEASQRAAALSVEIEEQYAERYTVVVVGEAQA